MEKAAKVAKVKLEEALSKAHKEFKSLKAKARAIEHKASNARVHILVEVIESLWNATIQ